MTNQRELWGGGEKKGKWQALTYMIPRLYLYIKIIQSIQGEEGGEWVPVCKSVELFLTENHSVW